MEERVSEVLKSIGLNKAEVQVFLDLLRYGPSSALEISKRTSLYRSNTYDSLRRLMEKGLVTETVEENKRTFTARNPDKIKDYIKQKENEVQTIIPFLAEFSNTKYDEGKTSVSYGPFSLRTVLRDLLELNSPIYVVAMSTNVEIFGEGFMEEFHKERIKKKIPLKMIYFQKAERIKQLNEMDFTDVRALQCEEDYHVARIYCADKMYLLTFEKPYTVIEIKNKTLVDSSVGTFNMLWKSATKAR